jgi:preprotein translocase subunit YajC
LQPGGDALSTGLYYIAFFPIFILLLVIIPQQKRMISKIKIKRKRGGSILTNELIQKYMGKNCMVSTGNFGGCAMGEITAVADKWIEVNTNKGSRLVNADFVTKITPLPVK